MRQVALNDLAVGDIHRCEITGAEAVTQVWIIFRLIAIHMAMPANRQSRTTAGTEGHGRTSGRGGQVDKRTCDPGNS